MFWKKRIVNGDTRIIEMREGTAEIFIEADPQKVWDCLSDIKNYHRWVTWFKAKVPLHIDRLEKVGDYFDYETTILGVKFTGRLVSVERIPPQRSAFCLVSQNRGGGEYLLEPMVGGTRVHYTIWGDIPSSYLGKIVERVVLANNVLKNMNDHLRNLKVYAEQEH